MTSPDLELIQKKLLERREALLEDTSLGMRRIAESRADVCADPIDQAASNCDFDLAAAQTRLESAELTAIVDALDRIADGTFGICEECDDRIGAKRLEALPSARLCIDCQRRSEADSPSFV